MRSDCPKTGHLEQAGAWAPRLQHPCHTRPRRTRWSSGIDVVVVAAARYAPGVWPIVRAKVSTKALVVAQPQAWPASVTLAPSPRRTILLGLVADAHGPRGAMIVLAAVPVVAVVLSALLREPARPTHADR